MPWTETIGALSDERLSLFWTSRPHNRMARQCCNALTPSRLCCTVVEKNSDSEESNHSTRSSMEQLPRKQAIASVVCLWCLCLFVSLPSLLNASLYAQLKFLYLDLFLLQRYFITVKYSRPSFNATVNSAFVRSTSISTRIVGVDCTSGQILPGYFPADRKSVV